MSITTKFYATIDSEYGHISEDADIFAFDTRDEAEAYLRAGYDAEDWSVEIDDGLFGDCWIKLHREPSDDEPFFAPFTADDLIVQRPGQHPGGRVWWISPRVDVLVAKVSPK